MRYRVVTRWSPLNVRVGPGLRFRVVLQLPRGQVVEVLETVQNEDGIWHRVANGWCSFLYLEPIAEDASRTNRPREQPPPAFLQFNPLPGQLERERAQLLEQIERAEQLAYTAGQVAAQHGSRRYELDSASRHWRDLENLPRAVGLEGDDPGVRGLEAAQDVRICRELEQLAEQREREVRRLRRQLERLDRELERLRQGTAE